MADLPPLPPPAERRQQWLVYGIALAVAAVLAVIAWRFWGSSEGDAQKTQASDSKGGKGSGKGGGKGGR
ncbi:MAG: hypothetical protein H7Y14_09010, partial [Burkholderiales bacterium]|nr:hypothetical protein [Burkholderiales bacterium]